MTAIAPRPARGGALNGAQKAAVLCMALGAEASARVLSKLSPAEIEAISRTIAHTAVVPPEMIDAVLGEFRETSRALSTTTSGGEEFAREVLEGALGIPRARNVMERIREAPAAADSAELGSANVETLQMALRDEQPQTLALVLAHLEPGVAAQMISGMNPELSAEVLYRVATMDKVSPEVLRLVETAIAERSKSTAAPDLQPSGGPAAAARVLNKLPTGSDEPLLAAVTARSSDVATRIRELMFVFEDLRLLDDRAMQRVLRDVDSRELATALKAASDELRDHILHNMSERAGAALKEELEMLGAVKVKDVQAAHANIIAAVRELQAAGEIQIDRGGDGDVIS